MAGKRRQLNQPLIKSVIVLVSAVVTAVLSAVTGIGAQVTFGPMLTWMFGYTPDKAQGTALRYALFAAATAFIVTSVFQGGAPMLVGRGLLLFIGATFGALAAAPLTPSQDALGRRRALQSVGIVLSTFVIIEATHLSAITRTSVHYALWSNWWQLVLLGGAAGALTQATSLAGGVWLVPALFFLTGTPEVRGGHYVRGITANEAVAQSLFVIFCAGLLPAWSYAQRKIADSTYLSSAIAGGLIGGAFGGWLLAQLLERSVLYAFGIAAMFLSGRELARLAMEGIPVADVQDPPSAGSA